MLYKALDFNLLFQGHTRVLKQYVISNRFTLVDMPGYGHNMPEYFSQMAEEYILNRKQSVFMLHNTKTASTHMVSSVRSDTMLLIDRFEKRIFSLHLI